MLKVADQEIIMDSNQLTPYEIIDNSDNSVYTVLLTREEYEKAINGNMLHQLEQK